MIARRLQRAELAVLTALALVGCAPAAPSPTPTPYVSPKLHFVVLGNASPSDTGGPMLAVLGSTVVIRGIAVQTLGAGLYGDLDLSEPRTLRLTLYDSVAGRPVDDPQPPAPPSDRRQVIYEARIAPVAPGGYDVWVGRFDARARLVEIAHEPLHIDVAPDYDTALLEAGATGLVPESGSHGGRLLVTVGPGAHRDDVRRVLERVVRDYRRADFRWPRAVDEAPHGTSLLAEQGDRVRYAIISASDGVAVEFRATADDAVAAIRDFLRSRRRELRR